jgi:HK97 gp10 family phage protein
VIGVKVSGLAELQKALNDLPIQVQGRPLKAAVSAAAKVIQDEAIKRAPQGETGNLRKAIYRTRSRSGSAIGKETYLVAVRKGKATYADTTKNRRLRRVGKKYTTAGEAYYWRFLEFGTSKMPAKPFLRPAFESQKERALEVLQRKLGDAIMKTAAKLKK